jgi:hypothetical protein
VVDTIVCAVCGDTADEKSSAVCNNCGDRFHLNQRNDQPGKDCGSVWIDERFLALEFACQRCLDGDSGSLARPAPRIIRPRIGRKRFRKRS